MADNNEQSREVRFGYTGGDNTLNLSDKEPGTGAITVKVNVDVSEALTGLKAVQREAREATKALREFEEAQKRSQALPSNFRTHSLHMKGGGGSIKTTPSRGKYISVHSQAQSITDDIRRSYE